MAGVKRIVAVAGDHIAAVKHRVVGMTAADAADKFVMVAVWRLEGQRDGKEHCGVSMQCMSKERMRKKRM